MVLSHALSLSLSLCFFVGTALWFLNSNRKRVMFMDAGRHASLHRALPENPAVACVAYIGLRTAATTGLVEQAFGLKTRPRRGELAVNDC